MAVVNFPSASPQSAAPTPAPVSFPKSNPVSLPKAAVVLPESDGKNSGLTEDNDWAASTSPKTQTPPRQASFPSNDGGLTADSFEPSSPPTRPKMIPKAQPVPRPVSPEPAVVEPKPAKALPKLPEPPGVSFPTTVPVAAAEPEYVPPKPKAVPKMGYPLPNFGKKAEPVPAPAAAAEVEAPPRPNNPPPKNVAAKKAAPELKRNDSVPKKVPPRAQDTTDPRTEALRDTVTRLKVASD